MASADTPLADYKFLVGELEVRHDGNDRVHASDFQTALNQLGYGFGHPVVDKVVTLCKLETDGFVDFSKLRDEVGRLETQLNNSGTKTPRRSIGRPVRDENVWTPGRTQRPEQTKIRKRELMAEKQSRAVRDSFDGIKTAFKALELGRITTDDFLERIQGMGVTLTNDAMTLVRQHRASELPFSKFVRALTLADFFAAAPDVAAGLRGPPGDNMHEVLKMGEETQAAMQVQRKKQDPTKNNSIFNTSGTPAAPKRRYYRHHNQAHRLSTMGQYLRMENVGEAEHPPTESWMASELSKAVHHHPHHKHTSEVKLLRHQLIACARKLELGHITASQFVDEMAELGVDIPDEGLTTLQNFERAGCINYVDFLRLFDKYIETVTHEDSDTEQVEDAISRLRAVLSQDSVCGLHALAQSFRRFDHDHTGHLPYSDFKKAVREVITSISDQDIRLVYHHFDTDDGLVPYHEILYKVRGEMSSKRLAAIYTAFRKLDKVGTGALSMEELEALFDASQHPDVVDGERSAEDVHDEFLRSFAPHTASGDKVTLEDFEEYYSSMSALIDNDAYFERLVINTWKLDPLPPPPPTFVLRKGVVKQAPVAAQTHGDIVTWNQMPSNLEKRSKRCHAGRRAHAPCTGQRPQVNLTWDAEPDDSDIKFLGISKRRVAPQRSDATRELLTMQYASESLPPPPPRTVGTQADRKQKPHPLEPRVKKWHAIHSLHHGSRPPFDVMDEHAGARREQQPRKARVPLSEFFKDGLPSCEPVVAQAS